SGRRPAHARYASDQIFPESADRILARFSRIIWWKHHGIVSIKRHGLIEIFRAGRFRPSRISVTNSLFISAFCSRRRSGANQSQWKQSDAKSQNEFCFHPSIESGIPFPVKIFPTTNGHQSTRIQTSFDSVLQNKMKETIFVSIRVYSWLAAGVG